MTKTRFLIGIILTFVVGCASNRSNPQGKTTALVGREWTLVALQGNAIVAERPPTLRFDEDGRVNGFGGINRISGSYARETNASPARLSFGQLISTRMAGDPTLMRMETTFLNALSSVDGYRIVGDELTLTSKQVVVAVLRPTSSAER